MSYVNEKIVLSGLKTAPIATVLPLKNPPVVIARQANIAHCPQQVNNGEPSRTRETQPEQSKLLEQTHGERLGTGTATEAFGSDPAMATVGAKQGTKDDRG
jgi:hypothetical protein